MSLKFRYQNVSNSRQGTWKSNRITPTYLKESHPYPLLKHVHYLLLLSGSKKIDMFFLFTWGRLHRWDLEFSIWDVKSSNHPWFTIPCSNIQKTTFRKNFGRCRSHIGQGHVQSHAEITFWHSKIVRTIFHSSVFVNQLNFDPCMPSCHIAHVNMN